MSLEADNPLTNASVADPNQKPSRVAWVDIAKGVGIILVVYGHVSGGLVDAGIQRGDSAANAASALIYTFHMPLFFFLSGIWLAKASAKPYSHFVKDRVGTIVYPYVLWSVIQLIANRAMGRFTNGVPELSLLSIAYRPYAQFWFLYVLFIDVLLVTLLLKLRYGPFLALLTGAVAYAMFSMAESVPWHPAAQCLRFLVYIAAGAAVGPSLVRLSRHRVTRPQAGLVAVACFAVLVAGYWRAKQPNALHLAVASVLGTVGTLALSWMLDAARSARVLEFLGRRSLEIYVCHVLGAAGVRIALIQLGISNATLHFILGVGIGLLFPLALWWIASQTKVRGLFSFRPKAGTSGGGVRGVAGDVIPV